MWAHNTAASLAIDHDHDGGADTESSDPAYVNRSTTYIGLGGRVRLGSSTYVAGEIAIRVRRLRPGPARVQREHREARRRAVFSMTFTNTFATTFAQLARGGGANSLFLGFNLGRKFF